jgi:predicted small metal-binding protein
MSKSKVSLKTFSCPCGWTLTTPTGEDDIVKHVNMHVKDFHKDMKTTREEIVKKIKNV